MGFEFIIFIAVGCIILGFILAIFKVGMRKKKFGYKINGMKKLTLRMDTEKLTLTNFK